MRKILLGLLASIVLASLVLVGCAPSASPTPTATSTPTSTPATTSTPTAKPSPTVVPTVSPTATSTPKPTTSPTPTTPANVIKWKLNVWVTTGQLQFKLFKDFAADVKKRTNGQLDITVYAPGELPYKPQEALRTLRDGLVELSETAFNYVSGDVPQISVVGASLMAITREEAEQNLKIADTYIRKALDKFGAEPLFYDLFPEKYIYTRKPISSLDDLKGMKMRATDNETSELWKRVGAVPLTLVAAEVYTALQRGLLDGTFTNLTAAVAQGVYEVTKYGWLLNIGFGTDAISISKKALAALPPDVAKALKEAAAEWGTKITDTALADNPVAMKTLQDKGMTFTKPAAKEIQTLQNIMKDVWNDAAVAGGPDALELLGKLLKAKGL